MRTLILGSLCAVSALVAQNSRLAITRLDDERVVRRPILIPLINAPLIRVPGAVQPSAFDEESSMSAAQLLNRWDGVIAEASQRFHVPKAWIRAVMANESGGRTMLGEGKPIISSAGAVGLMQVLPETYDEMALEHKLGPNPFNARDNIMAGTAYLSWLQQKYGYPAMFAAYNAGPGKLEGHLAHGGRLPAETRAYVGGIAKALHGGRSEPDRVIFTRPDGEVLKIDPSQVTAIRAPLPGEYGENVKAVLSLGPDRAQGICEDIATAQATIGKTMAQSGASQIAG